MPMGRDAMEKSDASASGSPAGKAGGAASRERALRALAGLLVVFGCTLRLFRLEADQDYYGWWGHIFDEGRWSEQARHLVLTLELPGELGHNAFVAPLHEVATTIVFALGGVSYFTARLFPALCGCALVILIWQWLRTRVDPASLVLGVAMVAFPADLVVLSRLAIPEAGTMLGTTIAVLLICTWPPRPIRLVVAGLAAAIMVGFKLTALFVVPVLIGIALVLRGRGAGLVDRVSDALWFLAGIVPPALVAGTGALLIVHGLGLDLASRLDSWSGFLIVRDLYAIVSLPFLAIDAPAITASCLALWLAGLALPSRGACSEDESRWYRAAISWALLWMLVYSLQGYFPSYYRVHILIPLALVAALSSARLARTGLDPLIERLRGARTPMRFLITGFLGGVLAAHLAAVTLPVWSRFGFETDRLSVRLSELLIFTVVSAAALYGRSTRPRVVAFVIAFSLVASVLHFAHWIVDPYRVEFFLTSPAQWPFRLGLLAISGLVAYAFVTRSSESGRRWIPAVAVAGVSSVAWLIHLGPGLLEPSYTTRDFSITLAEIHPADRPIWSHRTESAFIANRLEYRRLHPPQYKVELPPTIVTDLPLRYDEGTLETHYELVRAFEVYVPEHHTMPPYRSRYCSGTGQCFGVFRLKERGTAAAPIDPD